MLQGSCRQAGATLLRLVISVEDLETGLSFYAGLLGMTRVRDAAGLAWLRTADDVQVMLHERPTRASDSAVSAGFEVHDLHAVVEEWALRDGVIVKPPQVQAWGEAMAVVHDPDGHVVCLFERARPADGHAGPQGAESSS